MVRILIIDDHPIVRKGIRETVSDAPGLIVAGEAATGEAGLEWLAANECDLVTLDLSLPRAHGLEILEQIRARYRHLPVLILTMHAEVHYAARALKMGAAGFLPKDAPPDQLIEALRKVAAGGRFAPPGLAERLLFARVETGRAAPEVLSNREFLVLKMIGQGKAPREIADSLSISPKTVSTYRSRIMGKLGLNSGAELVRYCLENHLLDEEG